MARHYHIPAGEFKAKCLKIMSHVKEQHVEYVITKRGKPVAKLIPIEEEPVKVFGCLKNTVTIQGDIVSPIGEKWDAET